ncbi:MAG TPA: type II toxin-antitoxin system death-on-curing family toxin [Micropepsaceae bacterium]|nr:type II toxin-antitoxin system death-on-curing family toxin [Micropepsaceae bacterium]
MDEAYAAHEFVLARYGGLTGTRDRGALESALARPYCGYYLRIEKKAAALVQSITMNHGFVDGNKRTALMMLGILLSRSGYALVFPTTASMNQQLEAMVLAVAEHEIDFDGIAAWIKARLIKLS